jgi:hypothetical protein
MFSSGKLSLLLGIGLVAAASTLAPAAEPGHYG